MTTFVDGPAADATLFLKRAPLYVRVAIDTDGTVDALDQLADTPKPTEKLTAYERFDDVGSIHLCGRGRNGPSGWFVVAHYRVIDPQPAESQMRDTVEWQSWCRFKRDVRGK